jgi:Fe-S-cluster containining protein
MPLNFPEIKDGFYFECTLCGDCCTGDQEVLLNWYDLYKMARFLNYGHTADLFADGWVELVQDKVQKVWRPRIRFKERPFKFCPFLSNELDEQDELKGYCQMHPNHKPLVCALAPVGCQYDSTEKKTRFLQVPPTESCPGMERAVYNDLPAYLQPYRQEIAYQEMFFEALEKRKSAHCSKEAFLNKFYAFPVTERFEAIVQRLLGQVISPSRTEL